MISRRAQGTARGTVLLNGVPLTLRVFQQRCGYVTQRCDLIPGLTVQQTLTYTPTIVRYWDIKTYTSPAVSPSKSFFS